MKREMWLIWKNSGRGYRVGSLFYDGKTYIFRYVNPEIDEAISAGFLFFPGFEDLEKVYENGELFANIETRLPNKNRPDYLEILNSYDLEKDSSKIDILKATKGRLITDNYEFVPAFDETKVEFDVAGTRYCPDIEKCKNLLSINDCLLLELNENNEYDQNAIKVIYTDKNGNKYYLGYVPRILY